MVDVVVNHNGWKGTPENVDYSVFNPFNDEKYYHPPCDISFDISNDVRASSDFTLVSRLIQHCRQT
jgi:hypothetical protein